MRLAHADLVEQELARWSRSAPLEVGEQVSEHDTVLLRHPVQDVRVAEVRGGVRSGGRRSRPAALLQVEIRLVGRQHREHRLVAGPEAPDHVSACCAARNAGSGSLRLRSS